MLETIVKYNNSEIVAIPYLPRLGIQDKCVPGSRNQENIVKYKHFEIARSKNRETYGSVNCRSVFSCTFKVPHKTATGKDVGRLHFNHSCSTCCLHLFCNYYVITLYLGDSTKIQCIGLCIFRLHLFFH
jgi:hypothetical protein